MNAPRQVRSRLLFVSVGAASMPGFVCFVRLLPIVLLSVPAAIAQTCPRAEAFNHLDVNGVKAILAANEMQFFDFGRSDKPRYEVPAGSGIQSLFIANLMIAGSIDGETRTIQASYSTEAEFWSEPSRFAVLSFATTENELAQIPAVLTLREPYPNPTADIAHFEIGLPETGRVTLTAYDLLGRRMANIADDPMAAGWRTVDWNTAGVSNGVYVVRLQAGKAAISTKLVVVR